jgi:hypothetical protein
MTKAFLDFVESGKSISTNELEKLTLLIKEIKQYNDDVAIICKIAVKWVLNNPTPQKLGPVSYTI